MVFGSQPLTRPIAASGFGILPAAWLYALTVLRDSPVRSATSETPRYLFMVPTSICLFGCRMRAMNLDQLAAAVRQVVGDVDIDMLQVVRLPSGMAEIKVRRAEDRE